MEDVSAVTGAFGSAPSAPRTSPHTYSPENALWFLGTMLLGTLSQVPRQFTLPSILSTAIDILLPFSVVFLAFQARIATKQKRRTLKYNAQRQCFTVTNFSLLHAVSPTSDFRVGDVNKVCVDTSNLFNIRYFKIRLLDKRNRNLTSVIYSTECSLVPKLLRELCNANNIQYSEGSFNALGTVLPLLLHIAAWAAVVVGITAVYPVVIK